MTLGRFGALGLILVFVPLGCDSDDTPGGIVSSSQNGPSTVDLMGTGMASDTMGPVDPNMGNLVPPPPVMDAVPIDDASDQGGADGSGGENSQSGATAGVETDGGELECAAGEARCPAIGGVTREVCASGQWVEETCPEAYFCLGRRCVPQACSDGERVCLDADQPATCVNGAWQPASFCEAGLACSRGECVSAECARAEATNSYLGCEYLAVDLVNFVTAEENVSATPEAPTGVVVANTSPAESTRVSVYGPNGDLVALVPQVAIAPPTFDACPTEDTNGNGRLDSGEDQNRNQILDVSTPLVVPQRTIYSRVLDANGQPVGPAEAGISIADGLEIPPGGTATLLLPRNMAPQGVSSIRKAAYRVVSDQPVAAYQFSPYCCNYSFSNDASVLFPISALGGDYRYAGMPSQVFVSFGQQSCRETELAPGFTFTQCDTPDPTRVVMGQYMTIVSAQDGTAIEVDLGVDSDIAVGGPGPLIERGIDGSVNTILNRNDVLTLVNRPAQALAVPIPTLSGNADTRRSQIAALENELATQAAVADMTGARIRASGPVAVFSGHRCASHPRGTSACDHLQDQLTPISTWGRRFQLVPPVERNIFEDQNGNGRIDPGEDRNGNGILDCPIGLSCPSETETITWRILAGEANTTVRTSAIFNEAIYRGPVNPGVNSCLSLRVENDDRAFEIPAGGYCEFATKTPLQIEGSSPLMVMGTISGQASTNLPSDICNGDSAHAGDPSIFLLPPDRQFRREYSFLTPETYYSDYVTVIAPEGSQILLDGFTLDLFGAVSVPGSGFVYKHVAILRDGSHTMVGDRPFGIVVYAYDDFVSYAFPGGQNLTKR